MKRLSFVKSLSVATKIIHVKFDRCYHYSLTYSYTPQKIILFTFLK